MAEIQVVLSDAMQEPFRRWLADRGLHLFRIPGLSDDDLPTYGIGIGTSAVMTAEEVFRATLYGFCEACRAPRNVRRTESGDGVLTELICPNGHRQ